MAKTLCELKKWLKKDFEAYTALVNSPTHICRKCGRLANEKRLVCKPMKMTPPGK